MGEMSMNRVITTSISEFGDSFETPKWWKGSNKSWIDELNKVYLPYCTIIEKIDKDKLHKIQKACAPYYSKN